MDLLRAKRAKKFATAAAFTAGLLASTSAFAGQVTIDGVNIPIGFSLPGGFGLIAQTVVENIVTATGQSLSGVAAVTNIQQNPLTIVWTQGNNGVNLDVAFSGFTVASLVAPTLSTPGKITFTGGTVGVYAFNGALPNITSAGSVAHDLANAESGKLFLSLAAEPIDAAGDTLVVTIPAGNTTTSFTQATGSAQLDVTGGDAASTFKTCTFPDAFAPGGCTDLIYSQESFTSTTATDFNGSVGAHVQGTGQADFNTVPEPASIGFFGLGLLALGFFWRRVRG